MTLLKEREIYCIGHCLIPRIIRMKMVFGSESRQEFARMIRVAQDRVEVDDAVKRAASPDPFVYCLSSCFLGFRVVARKIYAFKGADGGANHLNPSNMGARDQLAVRVGHVLDSPYFSRISEVAAVRLGARKPDVIDSFEQYDVSDARQRQSVPVEASQGADGEAAGTDNEAVAQQPVTDYSFVDHC